MYNKDIKILEAWLKANGFEKEARALANLSSKTSGNSISKLSYNLESRDKFGKEESKKLEETFKSWWSLWTTDKDKLKETMQAISPEDAQSKYLRFFIINRYNHPGIKELLSMRTLDKTVTTDKIEFTHNVLDLIGLVPLLGEPADITNAAIYVYERKWLFAGISLLAALPLLGIGMSAVKKLLKAGKTDEAIRLIDYNMRKSGVSPGQAADFYENRMIELNKMLREMEADPRFEMFTEHMPDASEVQNELSKAYRTIFAKIKRSSEVLGTSHYRAQALEAISKRMDSQKLHDFKGSLENLDDFWNLTSKAGKETYIKIAEISAKEAISKVRASLTSEVKERIMQMYPKDSVTFKAWESYENYENFIKTVQEQYIKDYIDNINIEIMDSVDLALMRWGESALEATGSYHRGTKRIEINVPWIAIRRIDANSLVNNLKDTLHHELYHSIDNNIQEAMKKIGNADWPEVSTIQPFISENINSILGSSIKNLLDSNVLKNVDEYYLRPREIAARMSVLKQTASNEKRIKYLIEKYPDSNLAKYVSEQSSLGKTLLPENIAEHLMSDIRKKGGKIKLSESNNIYDLTRMFPSDASSEIWTKYLLPIYRAV